MKKILFFLIALAVPFMTQAQSSTDTLKKKELMDKLSSGTITKKEYRELGHLTFGSFQSEQSSLRFGIGFYPKPQEVSCRIWFGGKKKRFCFEDRFGLRYETYQIFNLTLSWHDLQNDFRFMYAWRKREGTRMYSGLGLDFSGIIFAKDDFEIDGYREIIPIGIEWFPSSRVPNLGLIGEASMRELSGLHISAGIVFYPR